MPYRHTGAQKLALKGEGAADEKIHKVLLPKLGDIRAFLDQLAVFPHTVFGDVCGDIGTRCHSFHQGAAGVAHLQNGAGLGISLGKQQKIIGLCTGQNQEIALRVAVAHAGGLGGDLALPDQGTHLAGLHGGIVHCLQPFLFLVNRGGCSFIDN